MAVPSYTTDLSSFNLTEATSGWTEFTGYIDPAASTPQDGDDAIQGTYMVSQPFKVTLGSLACPVSTPAAPVTPGNVFLIWHKFDAGSLLQTYANAGVRIGIGTLVGSFNMYNVGGSDVTPAPYGGWWNYAVDPTLTPNSTSGASGLRANTYSIVGALINLTATGPTRGNPHKIDAIRYGRAEARFTGGALADGYATFAGFAAQNDAAANRWGLLQAIAGGYRWKGLMLVGSGTACQFVDQNTSVLVDDTRRVSAGFNKIEIRNNSSYLSWTNVSVTAVGTVSRGQFQMIDDPPVALTGCVFTDVGTFEFRSNANISNTTFRRCGQIVQGSAAFDGCLITESRSVYAQMIVDNPDAIQNTQFVSAAVSHHAMQITSAGEFELYGVTFTSFQGSGTVGAAVYNNTTSHVTLNITGGGAVPTYRNGAGATTSMMLAITLRMTVLDANAAPVGGAYAYIDNNDIAPYIMNTTTDNSGIVQVGYSGDAVTGSRWRVRKYGYKPYKQLVDIGGSNINLPVTLVSDPQQT